jgi:hypothetical protein
MIWLLIGYMWLFIHRPFEIWPVLATVRLERIYMLVTITYWTVSGASIPSGNRLHRYFTAFILVLITSWTLSPYPDAGTATVENYLKFGVFYILLVTSVRESQSLRTILVGHFFIVTLLMAHSLREYFFNSRHHFTQGIVRLVPVGQSFDYNDLAGFIVSSLPLTWVLWRAWSTRWRRAVILGHVGMATWCIMLTGSRMGLVGLVLASVLACLSSSNRWRLLAMYPVLAAAFWMILPEDRKSRYLTLVDSSAGSSEAASSAGSLRYAGFEKSLPLFAERPLLGFGPMGFRAMKGVMPHNLYGQLLAELGVAGAVTFGLILLGTAQNALEARRIVRGASPIGDPLAWNTVVATSAAFLLLAIMAWGFNFLFWHIWLWLGGFQVVALRLLNEHAENCQWSESNALTLQAGGAEECLLECRPSQHDSWYATGHT